MEENSRKHEHYHHEGRDMAGGQTDFPWGVDADASRGRAAGDGCSGGCSIPTTADIIIERHIVHRGVDHVVDVVSTPADILWVDGGPRSRGRPCRASEER